MKVETSSRTTCMKPVFIKIIIATHEGCLVAVIDISGAFLPTKAINDTIIKLQDVIGSILTYINGSWAQYNVYEGLKRVPIVYIR